MSIKVSELYPDKSYNEITTNIKHKGCEKTHAKCPLKFKVYFIGSWTINQWNLNLFAFNFAVLSHVNCVPTAMQRYKPQKMIFVLTD